MNTDKENLYKWWFTYNPYEDEWTACRQEDISEVYNNYGSDKVLRGKSIDELKEKINLAK